MTKKIFMLQNFTNTDILVDYTFKLLIAYILYQN